MCYIMVADDLTTLSARIGVREIRQNLSVYLDRVKQGEVITVTEYGRAVAVLQPPPRTPASALEQLLIDGRAVAPTRSLRDLPRPRPAPAGAPRTGRVLDELRDDRF